MFNLKHFSNKNKTNHVSTRNRIQNHYVSPLEELDTRTRRWKPKKVIENERYEKLCQKGECNRFEPPPSSYEFFFINKKSTIETLNRLIERSRQTAQYTIDTENQLQKPPQQSLPALIQVEFIGPNHGSTIILIETLHLPFEDSILFEKIRELCQTILSKDNIMYSWGTLNEELKNFCRFNLFDQHHIQQVKMINTQDDFKDYFNAEYSSSTQIEMKTNEKYSLQLAMFIVFNQWLNKRMTLSNWGCGIDLSLNTFRTINRFDETYNEKLKNEKEYRGLMTNYAINDCLAVTQLVNRIEKWKSSKASPIRIEREESVDDGRMTIDHEQRQSLDEFCSVYEDLFQVLVSNEETRTFHNVSQKSFTDNSTIKRNVRLHDQDDEMMVHESDEPTRNDAPSRKPLDHHQRTTTTMYEEDGGGVQSDYAPRRIYLDPNPNDGSSNDMLIHDRNESSQVKRPSRLDRKRKPTAELTHQQLRNRISNDRRRAKRYRFEVIRRIYPLFNITKIKRILKSMNIFYTNINVVQQTLFIGLKNQEIANEVEGQLNDRLFTKQHFDRLYPKKTKSIYQH